MTLNAYFTYSIVLGDVRRRRAHPSREAFPAFLTLVAIPLTFSIATGSLGVLSFTFAKLGNNKYREVSPLVWILAILFVLRYAFLGSEEIGLPTFRAVWSARKHLEHEECCLPRAV